MVSLHGPQDHIGGDLDEGQLGQLPRLVLLDETLEREIEIPQGV
jgi:hypothetical protein